MINTKQGLRDAIDDLVDSDLAMASVIEQFGFPEPLGRDPGFSTLLRSIISQQVSTNAGIAIWKRLNSYLVDTSPQKVLSAPEEDLRSCGVSKQKIRYARALAHHIESGKLNLKKLEFMSDQEAISVLTSVVGIGTWTAEIYLMFALARKDIFPSGDLALQVAAGQLLNYKNRLSPSNLANIAQRWKPQRTTAAIMLWHYYSHVASKA